MKNFTIDIIGIRSEGLSRSDCAHRLKTSLTQTTSLLVFEEITKWINAPMSDLRTHHREKSTKREGQTCKWIDKDETLSWMQTGRSLCSIIGDGEPLRSDSNDNALA